MPAVTQPEERAIAKKPEPLAASGADPRQVAEAAATLWRAIEAALSPVIGVRGITALYQRSLLLASADHPWLVAAYEGALQPGDFSALRAALSQQAASDAAAAHVATLQVFRDLLDNLIGRSLTHRLLQAVWDHPSSGVAAQDQRHDH
jgi:hypothetical protein